MNLDTLMDLVPAYALGALDPADAALIEQIAAHDPAVRDEVAAFLETATALARQAAPNTDPSPQLRGRILDRIRATPQAKASSLPADSTPAGFVFKSAGDSDWHPGPVPGLRFKLLTVSRDMGYWMLLAELQPGSTIPSHDHRGSEQVYVLSGDLVTEGRTLGPGDLLHAEPGTHHRELRSPHGCVALLVEKAPPHVLAGK